jgi:hypothetical protein
MVGAMKMPTPKQQAEMLAVVERYAPPQVRAALVLARRLRQLRQLRRLRRLRLWRGKKNIK